MKTIMVLNPNESEQKTKRIFDKLKHTNMQNKTSKKDYICDICRKQFNEFSKYIDHIHAHETDEIDTEFNVIC